MGWPESSFSQPTTEGTTLRWIGAAFPPLMLFVSLVTCTGCGYVPPQTLETGLPQLDPGRLPIQLPTEAQRSPSLTPPGPIPTRPAHPSELASLTPSTEWTPPALPEGDPRPKLDPEAWLLTSIKMVDERTGWGIGGIKDPGDHILRTEDGGQSWIDVTPPHPSPPETPDDQMVTAYFMDAEHAWAIFHPYDYSSENQPAFLWIWHTVDSGATWKPGEPVEVPFIGENLHPPYLHFLDEDHGWVLTRRGFTGMHQYPVELFSLRDGGQRWERMVPAFTGETTLQSCPKTGLRFINPQKGFVMLEGLCPIIGPGTYTSTDGGETWTTELLEPPIGEAGVMPLSCDVEDSQLRPPTGLLLSVSCQWPGEGFPRTFHWYRSDDGGESWSQGSYPGGQLLTWDGSMMLALGREIHRSEDGGRSWTLVKTVNWNGNFSFVDLENGWAIAREADKIAVVRTEDGGETWSIIEPELIPP